MANNYKIICTTETYLSAQNVKEAEIAKTNDKSIRENRKN